MQGLSLEPPAADLEPRQTLGKKIKKQDGHNSLIMVFIAFGVLALTPKPTGKRPLKIPEENGMTFSDQTGPAIHSLHK